MKSAEAALTVAERQIDALKAQRGSAEANVAQANAQRDQAAINLSYTIVTRGWSRVASSTSAAASAQFAQPGTSLTMFVPDEIWIVANFKETQLDRMRPRPAGLDLDRRLSRTRLPRPCRERSAGSGTAFSLLPAENATGNYVKIVQRVPVKIIIDNPPTDVALGPGMSVVPTVRVDPSPSLCERLRARYERRARTRERAPRPSKPASTPG